jgi:hypothetical protein
MKKIPPSILSIKLPTESLYHKKSKSISKNSVLNNIINYYKDPWFYNDTNLDFQINSMNSMFRNENKSENEFSNEHFLQTEISNRKNTIKNLKIESYNKKKDDDLYFQKVFKLKNLLKIKKKPLNNLLNLRYAENDKQYIEIAKKENLNLILKGKPSKKLTNSKFLEDHLEDIKSKANFIRCVEDFVLPSIVIAKIKAVDYEMQKKNDEKKNVFMSPLSKRDIECLNKKNERKLFLSETLHINKL